MRAANILLNYAIARALTDGVRNHLLRYAFNVSCEEDLQDAIEVVLKTDDVDYKREYILPETTDRPDFFLTNEGVVVECKVQGSTNDVARQLARYAQHRDVVGIVLVTTLRKHRALPDTLNCRPIAVLHVRGSF